jgi:hypothetical protein
MLLVKVEARVGLLAGSGRWERGGEPYVGHIHHLLRGEKSRRLDALPLARRRCPILP